MVLDTEHIKDKIDSLKWGKLSAANRLKADKNNQALAARVAQLDNQINKLSLILELWKDVNI